LFGGIVFGIMAVVKFIDVVEYFSKKTGLTSTDRS
jgi:hypothetical protein